MITTAEEFLNLILQTNTQQVLNEDEQKIRDFKRNSDEVIETVNRSASVTFEKVVSIARGAYGVFENIMQAGGATMSTMTRAIVMGMFNFIDILAPIIAGMAVTPGMQIRAGLALAQIPIMVMAGKMAEINQIKTQTELNAVSHTLSWINSAIGRINW